MSIALESTHLRSASSLTKSDSALPLSEMYAEVLPAGLLRGQVVTCRGPAAYSIALGLVARAVAVGSWLAMVDLDQVSPEALVEFDIPLHRVVGVSAGDDLANVLSAVFDGFDAVMMPASRYRGALARRIAQRIRAKGVTLVVIDDTNEMRAHDTTSLGDIELAGTDIRWEGIGWGSGRLLARYLTVTSTGRRSPRPLQSAMQLPPQGDVYGGWPHDDETDGAVDELIDVAIDSEELRWRLRVV
ncbi:MAG: hypothetical protein ACO3SZ_02140 [Ilumatobacteraceae bacterium]